MTKTATAVSWVIGARQLRVSRNGQKSRIHDGVTDASMSRLNRIGGDRGTRVEEYDRIVLVDFDEDEGA